MPDTPPPPPQTIIDALPPAPEYALADDLIAYLRSHHLLRDIVMERPWDRADQAQALAMAAAAHGVAVAVCPLPADALPTAGDDAMALGCLAARLLVAIISTINVHAGSAASRTAALASFILSRILNWRSKADGIIAAEPVVSGVDTLDLAGIPALQNISAVAVSLRQGIDYSFYYRNL